MDNSRAPRDSAGQAHDDGMALDNVGGIPLPSAKSATHFETAASFVDCRREDRNDLLTTRPTPRKPNLDLRRARQSMRLSQAQFADAVRAAGNAIGAPNHCTKRLVQKWETGEHAACRPEYLRVLQAVTGLSARELGFRAMPGESGLHAVASRKAAEGAAGGSSGSASGADTAVPVVAMSGRTEHSLDTMIEASMDRLRHALEHPSTVDSRTAEFVEMATARLFDLEHHSSARLLVPTVDRHLARVTALLTAARNAGVRRKLMVSVGRSALLAGWLAFDRGDTPSANGFWDAAIGAAEGTLDADLMAASLTCQSYAAARRGDPGTAWQLAHIASLRTPDDPRATAWATARAALYAAQLGERGAAESTMRRSLEIGEGLPDPKAGDGGQPWTRFFSQARLLSSTAHTASLLKDPNAEDYVFQAIDGLGPAKVKARAVVLAEVALTLAIIGELELCLDYGGQAAALTRDMDVSVAADLLHDVIPVVLPYSDTRPVRELLPQLARLTRTADLEMKDEDHEPGRGA